MTMQKLSRPTGVTVLAILAILVAIFLLFTGAVLIGLGLVIGTYAASQITSSLAAAGYPGLASLGAGTIAAIVTAFGAIFLILGLLDVALGVGFLGGKGWAWTLGMIVSVINIVWNLLQIGFGSYSSAFGVIIFVIIAYYLTRPHVKAFFGRGSPMMRPSTPVKP